MKKRFNEIGANRLDYLKSFKYPNPRYNIIKGRKMYTMFILEGLAYTDIARLEKTSADRVKQIVSKFHILFIRYAGFERLKASLREEKY